MAPQSVMPGWLISAVFPVLYAQFGIQ